MKGDQIFILYSFVLGFSVPLTLTSVFYILVVRRLRTVGPKRRPVTEESKSCNPTKEATFRAKERKRSHKKVTKLVLTVITVYFVCWSPYWISQASYIVTIVIFSPYLYSMIRVNNILVLFDTSNQYRKFVQLKNQPKFLKILILSEYSHHNPMNVR